MNSFSFELCWHNNQQLQPLCSCRWLQQHSRRDKLVGSGLWALTRFSPRSSIRMCVSSWPWSPSWMKISSRGWSARITTRTCNRRKEWAGSPQRKAAASALRCFGSVPCGRTGHPRALWAAWLEFSGSRSAGECVEWRWCQTAWTSPGSRWPPKAETFTSTRSKRFVCLFVGSVWTTCNKLLHICYLQGFNETRVCVCSVVSFCESLQPRTVWTCWACFDIWHRSWHFNQSQMIMIWLFWRFVFDSDNLEFIRSSFKLAPFVFYFQFSSVLILEHISPMRRIQSSALEWGSWNNSSPPS